MGSKASPPSKLSPEGYWDDALGHPISSDGPATNRLLCRIADTLQVPVSTLYQPPAAIGTHAQSDGGMVAVSCIADECAALLTAYERIRDPAERHRLLGLVQEAAERT